MENPIKRLFQRHYKSKIERQLEELREEEMRLEYAWKDYKENARRYEEALDNEFAKRGGKHGRFH